jgi:hypothetical protein
MNEPRQDKNYRKAERMAFANKEKIHQFARGMIDKPVKKDGKTVGIVLDTYFNQDGDLMGVYGMTDGSRLTSKILSKEQTNYIELK